MRSFKAKTTGVVSYLAILALAFCAVAVAPAYSSARPDGNMITVANNSSRNITHLYLSSPDRDDWSSDQLDNVNLSPGQAFTLSNNTCSHSNVRVIAEDQDGCFVSTILACAENGSWSITDEAVPDCGN